MFVAGLKLMLLMVSPLEDGVGPLIDTQLLLWGMREVEYASSVVEVPHATQVPLP